MQKSRFLVLAGLIFLLGWGPAAQAAVRPHALTLDLGAGGYFFESQQDYKDSFLHSLGIGYNLGTHWAVEGTAGYVISKKKNDGNFDYNIYTGRLDLLRHFNPDNRFVPYLAFGLGGMVIDPERNRAPVDRDAFFDWGLGFKVALNDNIALRADARHYIVVDNSRLESSNQNFSATGGLQFQFGGGKETIRSIDRDGDGVIDSLDRCTGTAAGVVVDAFGCPADSDADGVYDIDDKCPGTPTGTTVDVSGCPADSDRDGVADDLDRCPDTPAGQAVDATGCPPPVSAMVDSDGDGVGDQEDKCPGTPAGVSVDSVGCPPDSDRDKVLDMDDKCPDTPTGVAVGRDGCPQPAAEKAMLKLSIEFASGQSAVPGTADPELDRAAAFIAAHPAANIVVEGHTDAVGSAAGNQKLSLLRAASVRQALVQRYHVPTDRISAAGFGESRPIADNSTPEGRLLNRRVVVRIAE
jgi:OmpA-OmpF porin, OOP family